jgi:cysteine desulfurase
MPIMRNSFLSTRAYFDCNATTPVLPSAADAAMEAMRTLYGNPSSSHLVGLQAKHILESTRKTAAQVIGADPEQVIFTSGATEAIQTAVFSALQNLKNQLQSSSDCARNLILYCATEHKAVPKAIHHWAKALHLPCQIEAIPVDSEGQIRLEFLREHLPRTAFLCTMAVNNETGVIQNLAAIESLLHETSSQALWLVDCVQALGKIKLQLNSLRINYATFSGHKLYAPKGIGFLYVKKDSPLTPLIAGGGQEKGLRSGTENLPGVAALGTVLEQLLLPEDQCVFHPQSRLVEFRNLLIAELKRAFPKVEFNMPVEKSVPTTINFSVPGLSSGELLDLFDSAGLRISAGSACSSAVIEPSPVLLAMGFSDWRCSTALRLSFGPLTSPAEILRGCQIIRECAMALQNSCLLELSGRFSAPENLKDGILQFRIGPTNSWLVVNREARTCIVIDPCEPITDRIEHYIRCQNLEVLAILDTHSHADHQSIRPVLQKVLADQMKIEGPQFDELGWPVGPFQALESITLSDGTQVPAIRISSSQSSETLVLAKLPTPGHTMDSHAYLFGKAEEGQLHPKNIRFVFSGDTILGGGLGRTNFSISNPENLFHSLRKLKSVLGTHTLLCPAHDYINSFAIELHSEAQSNSLLALALGPNTPMNLGLFLNRKNEIDSELAALEESFEGVVCGTTRNSKAGTEKGIAISLKQFKELLPDIQQTPWIIDVREEQEFSLFKDWNHLGLSLSPRNVPLSRFVNFIGELFAIEGRNQPVLLICKSGTRSFLAAQALRRLGLTQVWSLEGGLALSSQPETQ